MAHPVVHFEIGCQDKTKTSEFYTGVFGWKIDSGPMGTIDTGSSEGIQGHIASLDHEPHQYTQFYIQTDNVAQSLKDVEAAGGKSLVPPVELPIGTFAWFADPGGNRIGLWQPK